MEDRKKKWEGYQSDTQRMKGGTMTILEMGSKDWEKSLFFYQKVNWQRVT